MNQIPHPAIFFLSFCPSSGGISTHQASQIEFLTSKNIPVFFVDEHPQTTLERLSPSAQAVVKTEELPLWSRPRQSKKSVLRMLHEFRPSVVILNSPGVLTLYGLLLLRARHQLRFKIVFFNHSGIFTWRPAHLAMQAACGILLGLVDQQIYVSNFTKKYWERRFPWLILKRTEVVHNSIALEPGRVPSLPTPKPLRVGFVGRLTREKDPDLFCRVARLTCSQSKNFEFHIFGSGHLETALFEEYNDCVIFHGFTKTSEIFAAIDLLLNTSVVENCPFVVLEAKAWRIPLVATPLGGLGEISEHDFDAVHSLLRTPESLSTALFKAAENLPRLQEGCIKRASRFDQTQILPLLWRRLLA
jgi:glycosyltransferase involved in cell wall biosynthesis